MHEIVTVCSFIISPLPEKNVPFMSTIICVHHHIATSFWLISEVKPNVCACHLFTVTKSACVYTTLEFTFKWFSPQSVYAQNALNEFKTNPDAIFQPVA